VCDSPERCSAAVQRKTASESNSGLLRVSIDGSTVQYLHACFHRCCVLAPSQSSPPEISDGMHPLCASCEQPLCIRWNRSMLTNAHVSINGTTRRCLASGKSTPRRTAPARTTKFDEESDCAAVEQRMEMEVLRTHHMTWQRVVGGRFTPGNGAVVMKSDASLFLTYPLLITSLRTIGVGTAWKSLCLGRMCMILIAAMRCLYS
jgi:hypothetical protein